MAEWRDRGYVPDSDDDEDSLNCPPHTAAHHHLHDQLDDAGEPCLEKLATQPNPSLPSQSSHTSSLGPVTIDLEIPACSTATKLQAELHRGLEACKDVLTTTTGLSAYLEEEDSPLSSLSPSPSLIPVGLVKHPTPKPPSSPQQPGESHSLPVVVSSPPELRLDATSEALYVPTGSTSRSLRPRTLLQLNPYSLEYARYQQECNRRGIVPVRLANFVAERVKTNDNDTQLSEPFRESDPVSSPVRSASSTTFTQGGGIDESLRPAGGPRDTWSILDGNELPDFSDILPRRVSNAKPPPRDKMMSMVVDQGDDRPIFKRYKLPWQTAGNGQDKASIRQPSVFDHPMSPSPSEGATSDHLAAHGGDKLSAMQVTPLPLPTPVVSSDRPSAKRKVIELSSSSQEEDLSADDHGSQSSESENDDSQGLVQIRRRIKGVLPASWLKLDAKQQNQKTTTQSHASLENSTLPVKGVAKHISSTRPRHSPRTSAHKPITFSSDAEDSSASENERLPPSRGPIPDMGVWESEVEMDDVVVEDEIDRMVLSLGQPRERRKSKKTQQRLDDTWSNSRIPKPPRKQAILAKPRATTRRATTRSAVKRPKTRHRAHQLTVLDAPGFTLNDAQPPPQYLRIAARKRPSRRTALAQNVTHKYVQLPDLGDVVNTNGNLEELGFGGRSRTRLDREHRRTIDPTDAIVQDELCQKGNADSEAADSLDDLKQSTTAIVTRLRAGALRRSHQQQIVVGTARPQADGRHLSSLRAPDLDHSYRFQSAVPKWLEHVRFSEPPRSSNATKVIVVQPRLPTSNTDVNTMKLHPRGIKPQHELQRSRKRKPRPQKSLAEHLSPGADFPPILPLDPPDLILTGVPKINNEQDEALVVWVLDHLTLDYTIATKPGVPIVTNDALPSEVDLDDIMSNLFSRVRLLRTFLQFQSLARLQDLPSYSSSPTDEMRTFLSRFSNIIHSPGRKGHLEDAVAAFIGSTYTGPLSQLAATLLILSIICPLSRPNSEPLHLSDLSHKDAFDGWQVLQPTLSRFLNFYTTSNSQSQILGRRLGLLAVHFCYLAVRRWQWSSSDAIAKFWFKQYAQNDMIELFVVPDLGRVTERSKRPVLSLATDHNDTDYDIFLKLVAALLETRAQLIIAFCGSDVGRAAGRIQSLVFSISPNNSRKLSDDQNLHLGDLVSMANTYALYEYLNEFAPSGCQPRFALVEKLVDFPNCHWGVSQFALRTWSRFAHNAISRADIHMLNTLGSWIKRTTEQMALKLPPTSNDRHEPRSTGAEYALERNAARTGQQITELLLVWKAALVRCPTDNECKALLNGGEIEAIVDFCKDRRLSTVEVVTNVCELVEKYLDRAHTDLSDTVRTALHRQFRNIMIATLSSEEQLSTARLKPMTFLWYHFARATVRNKLKTWDDYLSLPSSWSFGLLAGSEASRQCKVLFLKMIVEDDTMHFELDREPFYSAWIEGLVQPQCNLCFEHELTKSIILRETDEMSFQDLRAMLRGKQGQLQLDILDFKQNQFEIVKHVIRSIFLLQFDDEDSQDYLGKPLNINQGRRLLKLMADTIKACWRALPIADRRPYTEFARSVVTQLRIYKYKDFDIDPWFIDPQQLEFPKEVPFANQFLLPVNQPRPMLDERLIRIFTTGNLQAAGTVQEHAWSADIVRALSATPATSAVDTQGKLAVNADLQFAFIRQVMSVHVCSIFKGPSHALFARPILIALLAIVRNWHFRLDINSDSILCQMLFTSADLLASILETLTLVGSQLAGQGQIGTLINVLADLASACIRRVTMLEALVEESEKNLDAVENGYACANALYEWLLPFCRGRSDTTSVTTGSGSADDTGISTEMTNFHKTSISSKTQTILEEALRGRNRQSWRMKHPLAKSWDAWLMGPEEDAGHDATRRELNPNYYFHVALKKLEDALMDANVLLEEHSRCEWGDQASVLL
ncbi:hypothetical protein DV736_g3812, partial [Chaetothyriales sp. CBS 134916]